MRTRNKPMFHYITLRMLLALPEETRDQALRERGAVVDGKHLALDITGIAKEYAKTRGHVGRIGGWIYREGKEYMHPICQGYLSYWHLYQAEIRAFINARLQEMQANAQS
jgi:hypothetical protein